MHTTIKSILFGVLGLSTVLQLSSCKMNSNADEKVNTDEVVSVLAADAHSFSNPNDIRVKHIHLDLTVSFDSRTLSGSARLDLNRLSESNTLKLDARQLSIDSIVLDNGEKANYKLGEDVEYFGQELSVDLLDEIKSVTIFYTTSPESEALQWLNPTQTAGGVHPYLFSQSQAILARTWVPCQDSPGVKFTYSATIRTSPELIALMSAENSYERSTDGVYEFQMKQPISSYLLALTVGDLEYRKLGRNCGVFAEPPMIEKCVWEFADMQAMIDSAEQLYGPYAWDQYDVVVLPPSFPFGGMENPRLTFATPTIVAGDRSLVALIAHELAHSWSGNLVTNETWNDFWLNEGFTVYFEQRIMEKVYGKAYEEMLTELGMGDLKHTIARLTESGDVDDTHLYLDLDGRNPDDGLTDVAYEKGRFFLQTIEKAVGRVQFDAFLKHYFADNAFKPMNTQRFEAYLDEHLLKGDSALYEKILPKAWIYGPGLPSTAPTPSSKELVRVNDQVELFLNGTSAEQLDTKNWTTHHWLYFLRKFDGKLDLEKAAALDNAFGFTNSGNNEILCDWFKHCIELNYEPAKPAIEKFLTTVGRRKFLSPLYERMATTEEGKAWGREIFAKAKPGYHAVSSNSIEDILQ